MSKSPNKEQLGVLISEQDVSETLKLSVATIRRWRLKRLGPSYLKLGASVRYRLEDIQSFIDEIAEQTKLRRLR